MIDYAFFLSFAESNTKKNNVACHTSSQTKNVRFANYFVCTIRVLALTLFDMGFDPFNENLAQLRNVICFAQ